MPSIQAVPTFRAPSLALLATEPLRALLDFCSSKLSQPPLVQGDGHPVIVYPGLGAGAITTARLRSHLKSCNFTAHDWELGVNRGPEGELDEWLAPLIERVLALHRKHGQRVSLVGWSLGGVYAREIAKLHPQAVRQVVTLATPFNSMGGGNHAGTIFKLLGGDTSHLTPELEARLSATPPVPTTSIFSKSDGIVSWRGCLEQVGPRVENVPVRSSHIGMPAHPDVFRILADRLAQPEGAWRPYSRRRAAGLRAPTAPSRSTR